MILNGNLGGWGFVELGGMVFLCFIFFLMLCFFFKFYILLVLFFVFFIGVDW